MSDEQVIVVFEVRPRQVVVLNLVNGGHELLALPSELPPTGDDLERVRREAGGSVLKWLPTPKSHPSEGVRQALAVLGANEDPSDVSLCRHCRKSQVCAVRVAASTTETRLTITKCDEHVDDA